MEPEGTSQQESSRIQSFPEMENIRIWSFQKSNKQIETNEGLPQKPSRNSKLC